MGYQELENLFNSSNELKFKMFSLEYVIRKIDDGVEIYALLYQNIKRKYSSFGEAIYNYTIYNEPLIDNIDRIKVIKDQ